MESSETDEGPTSSRPETSVPSIRRESHGGPPSRLPLGRCRPSLEQRDACPTSSFFHPVFPPARPRAS
jgi:hypothetical protein